MQRAIRALVLGSSAFTLTCGGGGGSATPDAARPDDARLDSSPDGPAGPCAAGCPANTWDIDHDPNTGMCGCEYQCVKTGDADPIDDLYTDDNCDGGDGVVAQCVYVSASLGDDTNGTGTREAPVKTLARGVAVAQANSVPAVCASGELYNEKVTVVSGINVYGGFDQANPDFAFKRSAGAITTVQAAGLVFDAPLIDADTYLEGLTIQATANPLVGASVYAVRLGGGAAQLIVQYNTITAANGNAGGNGTDGAAQAAAAAGQDGTNGTANGSAGGGGGAKGTCTEFGGNGGDGGYGTASGVSGGSGTGSATPGAGGHADSASFCSGTTGNNIGQPGGAATLAATDGAAGAGGLALGTIAAGDYKASNGANGTKGTSGKGGSGGGGGGGGDQSWRNVLHARSRRWRCGRRLRRQRWKPRDRWSWRRRELRGVRGSGSYRRRRQSDHHRQRRQGRERRERRRRSASRRRWHRRDSGRRRRSRRQWRKRHRWRRGCTRRRRRRRAECVSRLWSERAVHVLVERGLRARYCRPRRSGRNVRIERRRKSRRDRHRGSRGSGSVAFHARSHHRTSLI